jgi:hypothetical protein
VINQNEKLFSDENKPSRFLDKFCRIQDFREPSDDHKELGNVHGIEVHQAAYREKRLQHLGSAPSSPMKHSSQTSRGLAEGLLYPAADSNETARKKNPSGGSKRKNLKITFRGSQREGSPGQNDNDNTNANKYTNHNHNDNNNNEFYYHLKVDHDGKDHAHKRRESVSQSMRTLHPYFHSEKVLKNFYVSSEINLVKFFEKMNNAKNNITPHSYSEPLASKDSISRSSK